MGLIYKGKVIMQMFRQDKLHDLLVLIWMKKSQNIFRIADEVDKSKEKLINKIVEFGGRTFTLSIKKKKKPV